MANNINKFGNEYDEVTFRDVRGALQTINVENDATWTASSDTWVASISKAVGSTWGNTHFHTPWVPFAVESGTTKEEAIEGTKTSWNLYGASEDAPIVNSRWRAR